MGESKGSTLSYQIHAWQLQHLDRWPWPLAINPPCNAVVLIFLFRPSTLTSARISSFPSHPALPQTDHIYSRIYFSTPQSFPLSTFPTLSPLILSLTSSPPFPTIFNQKPVCGVVELVAYPVSLVKQRQYTLFQLKVRTSSRGDSGSIPGAVSRRGEGGWRILWTDVCEKALQGTGVLVRSAEDAETRTTWSFEVRDVNSDCVCWTREYVKWGTWAGKGGWYRYRHCCGVSYPSWNIDPYMMRKVFDWFA